ncbi:dynein regulation protein LC7 [Streptomyces ipomoeae]|jgi:predicted regulator of Ras-like GTPase activity (Roadblock/LC7/MglB family)|uniref:Roadblock/LC7 domain protein n=2 Tax=Streptomyces ipomoeae TaxID=103232 RepID=L1L8L0_9ACTN|nr:roadblock/LC7 domain-containing protein [Streptomyces ipomoeae]EKX69356.1 roadblock/LC7 domain protein [Streptomyces ipomoeae 91-03]MDX2693287.1 roadblock/LC7 domain-containing protein [Streptomyces ipomoeae]MDX2820673.1 roadblock/LC7 domain-containing protein [Streptomyces ipomoeae]MDX2838756.1 roadblock/LC7 domain-containing protein [Streptomyces ipomoeae]MDX2873180.1 roadblock/LC7 domain-containing protein [Streptomyces ipomoeae]
MTAHATTESLTGILASLRDRVLGVSESVLSTVDGLLVVADVDKVHPESVAALAAATLGVGRRMADQSGVGSLREVVVRCGVGHVIVVAVGERTLLTVVGDDGLDIAAFQRESPATVEQLNKALAADVTT